MSTAFNSHSPPIQPARIRYYEDQVLAASDLKDDRDYTDWLRRLHLRVLHDTWGIALGYDILTHADADYLLVTPGLAYDGWGREVVLVNTLQIPIPKHFSSEGLVLSIRYNETSETKSQRYTTCVLSQDPNLVLEGVEFSWQSPQQIRLGVDIPLGLFRSQPYRIALDLSIRRYVETLQRPHIGWDTFTVTVANEQELAPYLWKLPSQDPDREYAIGLRFQIETAAAGFTQTPFYFARCKFEVASTQMDLLLSQSFHSIAHPIPDRFTFQILWLTDRRRILSNLGPMANQGQVDRLQISIFWLGIEPIAGQETSLDQNQVFSWAGTRLSNWQMSGLMQFMTGHADYYADYHADYHADYATGGGA